MKKASVPTTYEDALEHLQSIIRKLEEGAIPIDDLEGKIEEAKEIVNFCEQRLRSISDKLAEHRDQSE